MSNTTFTAGGRQWRAGFTDDTEAAALHELGVRLADLAALRPDRLIERLQRDPHTLGGLIYLACSAECEARGVAPEEFARGINYANAPGVVAALMGALAARYPHSRFASGWRKYGKAR